MADSLLKASEVMDILGISNTTLWRWTRDGRLPVIKIGDVYKRYRREDVERLLESSIVTTTEAS